MTRQQAGSSGAGRWHAGKSSSSGDPGGPGSYSVYRLTAADWLREGALGAALDLAVSYTFYRSLPLFLVLLPAAVIGVPLLRRPVLRDRRLWELTLQFKEAIWILSGFLGAGLSVENAFAGALKELEKMYGPKGMITQEIAAIVRGIRLNKPVEGLLTDLADRSGLQDIRNFAEVFAIAKRSGGSMSEIIGRTTEVIRDKTAVTEEIRNMTASRRYEQNIMNVLPFAIIVYINLTSSGFLDVMYRTLAGRAVMTLCLAMLAGSWALSRKILDIRI